MLKKTFKIVLAFSLIILAFGISPVLADDDNSKEYQGKVSLHDAEVSDLMTFDELVEQYAEDSGVTIDEARASFYASMGTDANSIKRTASAQYRTLSDTLNVTTTYKPKINFYCEVSEGGGYASIKKVLNVNMNRVYNGFSKQFAGSVYYNLEDFTHIYYTIDGDFYDNGTTTVGVSIEIGIGEGASVTFGCSYASNHYAGFYVATRLKWGHA